RPAGLVPARSSRASLTRSSERMSRVWATGLTSQARAAARPCFVASTSVRTGPRLEGSSPTATTRPACWRRSMERYTTALCTCQTWPSWPSWPSCAAMALPCVACSVIRHSTSHSDSDSDGSPGLGIVQGYGRCALSDGLDLGGLRDKLAGLAGQAGLNSHRGPATVQGHRNGPHLAAGDRPEHLRGGRDRGRGLPLGQA